MLFFVYNLYKLYTKNYADYSEAQLYKLCQNRGIDACTNTNVLSKTQLIKILQDHDRPIAATSYTTANSNVFSSDQVDPLDRLIVVSPSSADDDKSTQANRLNTIQLSNSWSDNLQVPVNFSFSIASLICARFSGDYRKFIYKLHHCAPVAKKVAKSMIRVATTRIFANPLWNYQLILLILIVVCII